MNKENPIKKKIIFINSISSVIARIINIGLIIWLQRFLIIKVPTEEYSLYPIFVSITTFILLLESFFSTNLIRHLTDARALGHKGEITNIVSTMFIFSLIIAVFIVLIGFLFSYNINYLLIIKSEYEFDSFIIAIVISISFAIKILFSPFEVGLHVTQRYIVINLIEVLTVIFRIALIAFFFLLFGTRVIWVAISNEIANNTGLILRVILSKKVVPEIYFTFKRYDKKIVKNLISFGLWSLVGQTSYRIKTHSDPIILNKLANSFEVTVFYLGNMVINQLSAFILRVNNTILPGLTALNSQRQFEKLKRVYLRYSRIMIWINLFFTVPLLIYRKELFILYLGKKYLLAANIMGIMLISESISYSYSIVQKLAIAKGKIKFMSLVGIILQTINILLTIFLLREYNLGALGSAISTAFITIFLQSIILIVYSIKLVQTTFTEWLTTTIIPGYTPGVITLVFAVCIKWFLNDLISWNIVITEIIIVMMFYLIMLYLFGFRSEDREDLKNIINKISLFKYQA